jgi:hypothetical protein
MQQHLAVKNAPDIEMRLVAIADLYVDSGSGGYQRALDVIRANSYAKNFEPGAMKAINVSVRPDGRMMITDGQHTVHMAGQLGYTHIQAMVVHGSRESEAKCFLIGNGKGKKNATSKQRHDAALVARDPVALAAQSIMNTYDIAVSTGGLRKGFTNAIGAITSYSNANPAALKRAMDCIASAWKEDDCAWSGVVLRGMFDLAVGAHDMELIAAKLRKRKATARQVMDIASALQTAAGARGGGAAHAKAAILKACGIKVP